MSLFTVSRKGAVTILECPPAINQAAAQEFNETVQPWIEQPGPLYVLDMQKVTSLDRPAFRSLVLFYQALKNKGCALHAIHVSDEIAAAIQANGLDSALAPKKDLAEAMEAAGIKSLAKPAIDVEFVNPFIKATQTTLETQANTRVTIGKPRLKTETETHPIDIAGVISLSSAAFQGSIALCFSAKVFLAIYSNLLGEKHEVITKEIEDAAGEILNIIFGQAKAELNSRAGYQIQKAIPTIIRGKSLEVHHLSRNVAVILPFETAAGPFHIEISTQIS